MPTLLQMQDEYRTKAKRLHDIVKKAEDEDRGLTDEERSTFRSTEVELKTLKEDIELRERLNADYSMEMIGNQQREDLLRRQRDEQRRGHDDDPNRPLTTIERSQAFRAWLLKGAGDVDERSVKLAKRMGIWGQKEFTLRMDRGVAPSGERFQAPKSFREAIRQAETRAAMTAEQRATQLAGTDNVGGYSIPDEMMRTLEVNLLAYGGMRRYSEILSTSSGASLPMPTANDVSNEGAIVAEDAAVAEQTVAFGQFTLKAYKYSSKMIPISVELIQDSATDMPGFLGRIIGERLGRITNRHFTTGDGSTKPRGIVTDAANSTVVAGSAAELGFDEVLGLVHSVDPAYRELGAAFMGADSTILKMKLMSDTQGRPLWLPSLISGEPDTFAGFPYVVNQHMPTGSSAKGLIFGALSKYIIREVTGITFMRLDERYAEYHRVAFLAFLRCDGRLMDAGTAPVKYLTLAA